MPAEGLPWLPKPDMLTDEELLRVVGVFVGLGVRQMRLTGGEPLLRRSIVDVVAGIAALEPRPQIAMTTNGVGLERVAGRLADAGLDRVNVSLDTIDAETFTAPDPARPAVRRREGDGRSRRGGTDAGEGQRRRHAGHQRRGGRRRAGRGASTAGTSCGSSSRCRWTPSTRWDRATMVSADEVRARLSERFTLTPVPSGERGSAPAERFLVDGGPATVGIIASVSEPFCAACDRTRLTADGQVRNCLFSEVETDLRGPLRRGATDEELAALIQGEMWRKKRGHGIGDADFRQPDRPMSSIGG